MKQWKRLIAAVLTFCMLVSVMPMAVSAEEITEPPEENLPVETQVPEEPLPTETFPAETFLPEHSGTFGEDMAWEFQDGVLTISGTGEMENWDLADTYAPWYHLSEMVEKVVVCDGITKIGDNAFYSFGCMKEITLPGSMGIIGGFAFAGCTSLEMVNYDGTWHQFYEMIFCEGNDWFFGADVDWLKDPKRIVEITFEPVTVREMDCGHWSREIIDEETGESSPWYFHYDLGQLLQQSIYTIKYQDGTEEIGSGTTFSIYDQEYYFIYSSNQSYENSWIAGQSYVVDVELMGKPAQLSVTIDYSPVESLVIQPITIREGDCISWNTHYDEQTGEKIEYYEYSGWYLLERTDYTITFRNGDVVTKAESGSSSGFFYQGQWYDIWYATDQSYTERWTAGNTYYMIVEVMGKRVEVPVAIIESEVASIEIDGPITVVEEAFGEISDYYDPETDTYVPYFRYPEGRLLENVGFTVQFKNGESIQGVGTSFEYEGQWRTLDVRTNQGEEEQWTVGNTYKLKVFFQGAQVDVDVKIIPSPLESLEFTPVTITKNDCGYMNTEWTDEGEMSYFYYDPSFVINQSTYTANFTDAPAAEGTDSGFYYKDNWYGFEISTNQNYYNQWTVGNTYYVTVSVMGKTATIPVTIEENPLLSIEFQGLEIPEKTNGYMNPAYGGFGEYLGEFFCYETSMLLQKTTYVARFRDGTVLTNTSPGCAEGHFTYNGKVYEFVHSTNQSYDNQWVVGGNYSIDVSVLGLTVEVPVSITPTPLESISVPAIAVQEGDQGYWTSDFDEFTGSYLEYFCYDVCQLINDAGYTLTFRDGTQFTTYNNYFTYNGEEYYLDLQYEQSYNNQWTPGNTYIVQVSAMNQTAEVSITVNDSPLVSLVFEPIFVPEYQNGYWNSYYHPITGNYSSYYHYDEWSLLSQTNFVATFENGEVIKGNANMSGFFYNGTWYAFSYSFNQGPECKWYANNTYNMTVRVLGKSADVSVSICSAGHADGYDYIVQNNMTIITNCSLREPIIQIPETLGGYPVTGITSLGEAADHVEEIFLPDSVTMLSDYAFVTYYAATSMIRKITFGSAISSITSQMLSYLPWLEEIAVSQDNTNYCTIDGVLYNADCTAMVAYPLAKQDLHQIPDTVEDISALITSLMNSSSIRVRFGAGVQGYVMENGVVYNSDKTAVIATTADTEGVYNMPETVTEIGEGAFAYSNFTEVTISPNVTDIVYGAFFESVRLEKVTIPDSVTSIGQFAFGRCSSLQSAVIPASVRQIGFEAYVGCDVLDEVHIESLESWCSIYFDDTTANPLSQGGNLYLNGEKITNLVIPESVTDIGYYSFTFAKIQTVEIPDSIQSIGRDAFAFSELTSVEIPESVWYLGARAFYHCMQLERATLNSSITEIPHGAFASTALKSITIPQNVRYIYSDAFADANLSEVVIESDNLEMYDGAFRGNSIRELDLKDGTYCLSSRTFLDNLLTTATVPDSVTAIQYQTFAYNGNLISITIPQSVQTIEPCAFEGDTNLLHVLYTGTQEQWSQVENYSLYPANIHFEATGDEITWEETCTTITYYCSICDKYETVNKGIKTHTMIDGVCRDCGQIGDWEYVVDEETDTVTITGYCGNGTELFVPDSISGMPVTAIMDNAFYGNRKAVVIQIPDSVKTIGEYAFSDCIALEKLDLGNGLTTIAPYSFAYTYKLRDVEIPDSVTTIAYGAFAHSGLYVAIIPESVTTIEPSAFQGCWELSKVIYKGSPDQLALMNIGAGNHGLVMDLISCEKPCGHRIIDSGYCTTCHEKTAVTVADSDGSRVIHESLADALHVAQEGQTVAIHEDMVAEEIELALGAELDLNGHTLTVDSLNTMGGNIVDNSPDGSGLILADEESVLAIAPDNAQVPVYDEQAGGYRLFAISVQPCAITGRGGETPKYWFRVDSNHFGNLNDLIQEGAEVQIKAKLTWEGQEADTEATASVEFVKEWAGRCNENRDIYIVFTVSGVENVENFTLIPSVVANGVTVIGEDMN